VLGLVALGGGCGVKRHHFWHQGEGVEGVCFGAKIGGLGLG
jgi:hypothetical protein